MRTNAGARVRVTMTQRLFYGWVDVNCQQSEVKIRNARWKTDGSILGE